METAPQAEPQITSVDEAAARAAQIGYPILMKPWGGDDSVQEYVVENETDLRKYFPDALRSSVNEERVHIIHLTGKGHQAGPRYPEST